MNLRPDRDESSGARLACSIKGHLDEVRCEVDPLCLHSTDGVFHRGKKPGMMQFDEQTEGADDAEPSQTGGATSTHFVNHDERQPFLLCGLNDSGLTRTESLKQQVVGEESLWADFTPGCGEYLRGSVIWVGPRNHVIMSLG